MPKTKNFFLFFFLFRTQTRTQTQIPHKLENSNQIINPWVFWTNKIFKNISVISYTQFTRQVVDKLSIIN